MAKQNVLTTIGFLLFMVGAIGLILQLVGLQLSIFAYLSRVSPLANLLTQLAFIIVGLIIVYISKSNNELVD